MRREVVQRRAVLPAQVEDVGVPRGAAERHPRAGALEQQVGHDRRPVHHPGDGRCRLA
jgi:hypothetical protein